jgi:hypothetical protein
MDKDTSILPYVVARYHIMDINCNAGRHLRADSYDQSEQYAPVISRAFSYFQAAKPGGYTTSVFGEFFSFMAG